jgi:nicotinamide mononucleotide adenylyltransferase
MKINYRYGLIIGRFQPPCLHHFEFIKEVLNSGVKKLLIGIGESQSFDSRNFLTGLEVKSLMIPNLDQLNFPYKLITIPDINNPQKYVDHVKNFFLEIDESNTCLFTENSYTSDCFINYGHHYKFIIPTILDNRATNVRQLMLKNNSNWKNLVPENVLEYINNKNKIPIL